MCVGLILRSFRYDFNMNYEKSLNEQYYITTTFPTAYKVLCLSFLINRSLPHILPADKNVDRFSFRPQIH